MENGLKIAGFIETSLVDWDGKISSVVFLSRCNFRCVFCHNHDLFSEDGLESIGEDTILETLKRNKDWIDGLVISGGEPTLQGEALISFIRKIKEAGFLVKLDTNGTNPRLLKKLLDEKLIDYVAMDIKTSLSPKKYSKVTGKPDNLENIKESIKLLKNSDIDYEFRTTVVPTLTSKKDILNIAEFIKDCKRYVLQQYNPKNAFNPDFRSIKPYNEKTLSFLAKEANKFVKTDLRLR
ncbi:MAG: anaerobic ribonucleoside-triphosphate reductase activating protein [Candidatus Hydrothermarchaeota archaeon]